MTSTLPTLCSVSCLVLDKNYPKNSNTTEAKSNCHSVNSVTDPCSHTTITVSTEPPPAPPSNTSSRATLPPDMSWSELPFSQDSDTNFLLKKPDIYSPKELKNKYFVLPNKLVFADKHLPDTFSPIQENTRLPMHSFVNLYQNVAIYGTYNYCGARIPLDHTRINISCFRDYLQRINYPDISVLQYLEYGFPLGLVESPSLKPATKNHSSS